MSGGAGPNTERTSVGPSRPAPANLLPRLMPLGRWPAMFAGCFGLLHGLGFAAALHELGLPEQAIPLALLSFNVGVELGQLAFIAVVIGILAMAGALTTRRAEGAAWHVPGITVPVAYLIGSTAMFWVFERTSALWL